MAQSIAALTYDRPRDAATIATELETEYRISSPGANRVKVEAYMTLDPDNVAQVSTITILAGSVDDDYVITLTVAGVSKVYRHKQVLGNTPTAIAAFLATLLNTSPDVVATAVAGVITLKSTIPGQAFTLEKTGSTVANNVTIATTTPSSGTVLHRKVGEVEITFSIGGNGFPQFSVDGTWFNGAEVPVIQQLFGPLRGVAPVTVDSLQTSAGVTRE